VFLDIDPGFGQMWQALGQHAAFRGHDAYVTIAENMGKPDCAIPTCGLEWITTRQPVVLDEWPATPPPSPRDAAITSVATWRGAYGAIVHQDTTYGLRVHEFRRFATLPALTGNRFELALDIHAADARDIDMLSSNGWSLVEPRAVAGDPWRYRDYIHRSAAELMIAKGMYVKTGSGWFSDRSTCYLASGRPVLAQDTGLANLLPTGDGLLTFSSVEEAAEATRAVDRDYERHAQAARRVAEECFDSSRVLSDLSRRLNLC
jgi:Glycosyl transferases group 1